MAASAEVAGDISAASSAVSALILVYIGACTAGYSAFEPLERKTVRASFKKRAWFAFLGLVFFLASVAFSIFGKWYDKAWAVVVAMALMLVGFAWVIATAVLTIQEID